MLALIRSSAQERTRAAQVLTPPQPSPARALSLCRFAAAPRLAWRACTGDRPGVDEHALLAPPLPLTRASPRRARARDVRPSQVLKGHLFLSAVARLLPPPLADMGAYAHVPSHPGLEPPPSHAPPHPAIARAARAEVARACRLEPFEPLRARAGWEGSGAQRHAHRGTG